MRISDWSSDVCSSDLDGLLELAAVGAGRGGAFAGRRHAAAVAGVGVAPGDRLADRRGGCALVGALRLLAVDRVHGAADLAANEEIGRASWRERVSQSG